MQKLNELVEIADDAISSGVYVLNVKVCDILAISEYVRELEQNAQADAEYAKSGWKCAGEVATEGEE